MSLIDSLLCVCVCVCECVCTSGSRKIINDDRRKSSTQHHILLCTTITHPVSISHNPPSIPISTYPYLTTNPVSLSQPIPTNPPSIPISTYPYLTTHPVSLSRIPAAHHQSLGTHGSLERSRHGYRRPGHRIQTLHQTVEQ